MNFKMVGYTLYATIFILISFASMEVIHLPDALPIENADFAIFDYQTQKNTIKQMVSLQQNTFSFLLDGHKEVFSNNTTISIGKANFLLMKKGRCLMTEKITNEINENYRSMLLFFSNDALLNVIKKHKIAVLKPNKNASVFSFEYDNFMHSFVNSLIDIYKLPAKLQSKLIALKFEELILYLINTSSNNFIPSLIQEIQSLHFMETIEVNKLNKLTLKELSFLCNMSLSTFKREFEKQFQTSPSKWFLEQRLEHAAFLLKNTNTRPSDIFEEIGYESLSNFIQAFKNKFGVTPKQHQK